MRLNLKIAILKAGKSQRQLGAETEIPETRLSQIIQGWVQPTQREQAAIAAALHKAPEKLFAGTAGAPKPGSTVEVS